MTTWNPDKLARHRRQQERHMFDLCQHLQRERTYDEAGQQIYAYIPKLEYECGFDPGSSTEISVGDRRVVTNGSIRLPYRAQGVVKSTDQIQILKRFGETLERQPVFEIIGEPEVGHSAITANLRNIQT